MSKQTSHVRGLRFNQELLESVENVAKLERRSFANAAIWLIEKGLELYYEEGRAMDYLDALEEPLHPGTEDK